jgi:hypothetical protein
VILNHVIAGYGHSQAVFAAAAVDEGGPSKLEAEASTQGDLHQKGFTSKTSLIIQGNKWVWTGEA